MGNPRWPSEFDEEFKIVLFTDFIHWIDAHCIHAFVSFLFDFLPISIVKYLIDDTI